MKTAIIILATAILLAWVVGCHDPAYEAALARRQQRTKAVWTRMAEREAGRPAKTEDLLRTSARLQALYSQRLEQTFDRLEARSLEANQRWRSEHDKRADAIKDQAKGDPHWIVKFIQDVFY